MPSRLMLLGVVATALLAACSGEPDATTVAGRWQLEDGEVRFDAVRSTAMSCPEAESDLLAWSAWQSARVEDDGERLVLTQDDQTLVYVRS